MAYFQSSHSVICKAHDKSGQMFVQHVENAKHHMSVWFFLISPMNKCRLKLGGEG